MLKQNETLLSYYKKTGNKLSVAQKIAIIDAMCTQEYPKPSKKFQKQIIEFVEYFKAHENEFFTRNQDTIIFRMYAEIIKDAVDDKQKQIHNSITSDEQKTAKAFAEHIFSLKKDVIYVINAGGKSYMNGITDVKSLASNIEYAIYCKNAVILFYIINNGEKCAFGFSVKNGVIEEIDVAQMLNKTTNNDVKFTTFESLTGKKVDF